MTARESARLLAAIATLATLLTLPLVAGASASAGDSDPTVQLTSIAEVEDPTAMAVRPDDPTLYVAEQEGRIRSIRGRKVRGTALDIRTRVLAEGERGLLGITFSPDGTKLYVHSTDTNTNTRIEEYDFVASPGGGGEADVSTRRVLLTLRDFEDNHNGGQLAFGDDGLLYIGLGDGGGGGDEGEGHARGGNGQSLDTLLGKILRIDPTPSASLPYTIPPDNPFANGGGRPEIWSYGLRNPWRFSFDRESGDLWIADVGQDEWEEINVARAVNGAGRDVNFGWNVFEGSHRFRSGRITGNVSPPLLELSHEDGYCSITGGYVYRGKRVPDLADAYVYADYCNGEIRWVRQDENRIVSEGSLGVSAEQVTSFGEDRKGELYVLSQGDGLQRIDRG